MTIHNKLNFKIIFLGAIFGLLITLFAGTVLMLGVTVITGIVLWKFLPESDRRFLIILFITGISIRIILLAILYTSSIAMGGSGEVIPDSRMYVMRTLGMIRSWTGETGNYPRHVEAKVGDSSYVYLLSFYYLLVGFKPVVFNPIVLFSDKLINCIIGTISSIPIFYITKDIFGKTAAKISSFLTVFFPTLILWSITNLREPVNILLVSLIIFSAIKLQKQGGMRYFILIIVSLMLLMTIRKYIFFPTLAVIIISSLIIFYNNFKKKILFRPIIIILIVAFFLILMSSGYGDVLKNNFFNTDTILKRLSIDTHNVLTQKGSTYDIYDESLLSLKIPSGFKLIIAFFKGWFYFMLVPFPWGITTMLNFFASPQMIIWYLLLPFVLLGIIFAIRHRFQISFIIIGYLFVVTTGFALREGNMGSAMRHRDLVTPFYFIFSSVGLLLVFNRGALIEEKK